MSSNNDYHISPKEQQKVAQSFPSSQVRVQLAFKANFVIDDKQYSDGIVALSEHFILLFKRSGMTGSLSVVCTIHLLKIELLNIISRDRCRIEPNEQQIEIISSQVLRFCKCLVRDYYVITTFYPPYLRFRFTAYDPSIIPIFAPRMSPSQIFQFLYNAECSLYKVNYQHSIVEYFSNLISTRDGIFDLNWISNSLIDSQLNPTFSFSSFFQSLLFCPIVYGIICKNLSCPGILREISPIIVAKSIPIHS